MSYHEGPRCGGALRGGGRRGEHCTKPAGWGTSHPGSSRCKFHDGPQVSKAVAALAPYLAVTVGNVSATQLDEIQALDRAALIVQRSRLIERMSLPNIAIHELAELHHRYGSPRLPSLPKSFAPSGAQTASSPVLPSSTSAAGANVLGRMMHHRAP